MLTSLYDEYDEYDLQKRIYTIYMFVTSHFVLV